LSEEIKDDNDVFSKTEGNLYFYPPENCTGQTRTFAAKPVDIWAFGVCIFIITFKKLPFLPSNPQNLLELFRMIGKVE
jgi:serine/threonine protein kinase